MPARNASFRRRWSNCVRKPLGVPPRSCSATGHRLLDESSDIPPVLIGGANGGRPERARIDKSAFERLPYGLMDLCRIRPGRGGINDRSGGRGHADALVGLDLLLGEWGQLHLERGRRAMKGTRHGDQDTLESAGPRVIAQQGVGDAVLVGIATVEVPALRESERFKAAAVGLLSRAWHSCYNSCSFLAGIAAGHRPSCH